MWNTIALVLALFLVLLNGFFVAAEFAIVKIRATRLDELSRQGNRRARAARRMVDHMDAYLSATQLGITLASLGLGWIGEPAFAHLIEPLFAGLGAYSAVAAHSASLTLAFGLITFLHIVFGELAPKSIAIQRAEGTVLWVAWPMHLFYRLSYPAIWALNGIANLALRGVGVRPVSGQERAHSEEELRMILAASQRSGVLTAQEAEILQNVFQFADLTVRQIMIPRGEVVTLDATAALPGNLEVAKKHGHTRYPLCEGSLDRVVGIVHIKDLLWLLREQGEAADIHRIARKPFFVPETRLIARALKDFQAQRQHMAIVLDEFGGAVGAVTLEAVLEKLVGEIQDEQDVGEIPPLVRAADGRFEADGRLTLDVAARELDLRLPPPSRPDIETLGAYVEATLGRAPRPGDSVDLGGMCIPALEIRDGHIRRMRGVPLEPSEDAGNAATPGV
jgi:CBS domain containing-hemolysin-like protein